MRKQLLMTLLVVALLPLSASAQEGKAVLKNVASGLYWAAGNNWGTRASLMPAAQYQTLHKQPDGTYKMETHVSNGNGAFCFNGTYMDNGYPVSLTLKPNDDGYYTISNGDIYYGFENNTAGSFKGSYVFPDPQASVDPEGTGALWQVIFEEDWDDYMATATPQNPIDATFYILDADFGRNNRHSSKENNDLGQIWTMVAGNQNLSGGKNENRCAESWRSTFTLSQTIDVPNGKYIVRAQAALTDYDNVGKDYPVIYANDETSDFKLMTSGEDSMDKMSDQFSKGMYEVDPIMIFVFDGKLTIGAKCDRNNTWSIWDNFRLEYQGVNDEYYNALVSEWQKVLAQAQQLSTSEDKMSDKVRSELEQAVADNSSVDQTSDEAMMTAIKALKEAIADGEASIKSYKLLAAGVMDEWSAEGWVCTNGGNCRINSWSVEGDTDGSGMTTPFIENWVNGWSGATLGNGQVYYALPGLEPGLKVKVTLLYRAFSELKNEISGVTYFVGDEIVDIIAEGNKGEGIVYGDFSAIGTVGESGELRFGVETNGATFNFGAIKNVRLEIVPPSPDVTIIGFSAPATVAISDDVKSFEVTMTITNQGDADAKNVVVKLYNGTTVVATYPASGAEATGAPAEGLTLAPGESQEVTFTYDQELTAGTTLSLKARIDCDDEYEDYTENNTTSTSSVKIVMDGSDMTITGLEAPKSLLVGEGETEVTGTVKVTVKNLGTQPAEGVSVVLNVNGEKYASSDPITVEAGEEQVVEIEFSATESGDYTVTAVVTSDADIDEENNEWTEEAVIKVKKVGELTDGLDVSIEGIDIPEMADGAIKVNDEAGGYTVNVSVYNNGNVDAQNVVVTLYINGEPYATNADVEGFETLNLEPADMIEIPFFVENPEFTDVEIYAEVVVEGDVDETNNVSETIKAGVNYEGLDVAYLYMTYPSVIDMDSDEEAIVAVMVKNVSEDSRVTDDLKLKAENVVVHLYIDGVECATSKPFSLYKGSDAHAYLAIDRSFLTSDLVILTAQVTADKDGNPSNDWSEEVEIAVVGVVTGIDSILAKYGADATIYTIDGKKVDLNSGMLKKGLYIINGKKAAIK